MLIFLIGIILGLLFTYRYRYRLGFINIGFKRIIMYIFGISLSIIYSYLLLFFLTLIAPVEYYSFKTEILGAINTTQQINGNLYFRFGEIKSNFVYHCMVQRKDGVIYSIEIPSKISFIYEDANQPQVITVCKRPIGIWKLITLPDNKIYAYLIHVPKGTTVPGGSIQ